jgi:hypothetical protein
MQIVNTLARLTGPAATVAMGAILLVHADGASPNSGGSRSGSPSSPSFTNTIHPIISGENYGI